jgi:ParB family chromosome partitioning protein
MQMAKLKGLGRGLDALLSGSEERADDTLTELAVGLLKPGRFQPRTRMDPQSIAELADSIKAQGLIQPILVRPVENGKYEIIAGERRWRAAQIAGLATIPAVIRRVPDEPAIAMALIENIQRENLNPLEEARALERLVTEFGITHQQAADAVGRSRAAVSNLLRLLELAPEITAFVERRELEMGHARALLGLTQRRQQIEVGSLVAKKGLSVRETEALVRSMLARASGGSAPRVEKGLDPNVQRLQDELSEKLGAPVQIQHSGKGAGKVVVSYHSLDELDGILAHIR